MCRRTARAFIGRGDVAVVIETVFSGARVSSLSLVSRLSLAVTRIRNIALTRFRLSCLASKEPPRSRRICRVYIPTQALLHAQLSFTAKRVDNKTIGYRENQLDVRSCLRIHISTYRIVIAVHEKRGIPCITRIACRTAVS